MKPLVPSSSDVQSDRVMKSVLAPPLYPLPKDLLFNKKGMPILSVLKV